MARHPGLRVGYRDVIAAWLKAEGYPHDSRFVDGLFELEADWIEASNHLAIPGEKTDHEFDRPFDLALNRSRLSRRTPSSRKTHGR